MVRLPLVVLVLGLASCTTSGPLAEPPAGFLVLERDEAGYRATTADGARLFIRSFPDPNDGELAFWADALEHDFTRNRGYELVAREAVHDSDGEVGDSQHYRTVHDGTPHDYLVVIFDRGSTIRILEFTADHETFETHVAAVRAALPKLR
ncbi:MAG: hypothetical protein KDB80_00450 [Planctomycetes bacterium]|nr:hypothetical protein [Planctomycetota bacterium]